MHSGHPNLNVDLKVGLAGFFKIDKVKFDADGKEIFREEVAPWQHNLVTDGGLDFPGTIQTTIGFLDHCRLGSGSTPPAFSDTVLVNQLGFDSVTSGETGVSASSVSPYYKRFTATYTFAPGNATGNISEIAIAPASTGQVFSRALIKDLAGNPTTITKLADEQLEVSYEFRCYLPETDWTGTVIIDGISYDVTIRVAMAAEDYAPFEDTIWCFGQSLMTSTGTTIAINLGPVTGTINPLNSTQQTVTDTQSAYIAGTYYKQTKWDMALTQFNISGGVRVMEANSGSPCKWQIKFVPPIPKDGTKIMSLTFRLHWARHIF